MPRQFQPPIDDLNAAWTMREQATFEEKLASTSTIVGSPDTVKRKLESFINDTRANEIIINSHIFHHEDRLRSYELVAEMMD